MNTASALALQWAARSDAATMAATLLGRHVADGYGHCRGCALPQSGPTRWPCTTYATATEVQALITGQGGR